MTRFSRITLDSFFFFFESTNLCYGVDVHLLSRRRHRGNTGLLISLISCHKAETPKQLVCVCTRRDARRIWMERHKDKHTLWGTFKTCSKSKYASFNFCTKSYMFTCFMLPVGVLEVNSGSKWKVSSGLPTVGLNGGLISFLYNFYRNN